MLSFKPATRLRSRNCHSFSSALKWPHTVYASNEITNKKSTFLAHASAFNSSDDLSRFLDHIQLDNSRIKRATHCMYAWRISTATNPNQSYQSDGGEKGAGDQLARILQLSGSNNAIIVVWRWYGGVKLGSERWRVIKSVAVEALDAGGWITKGRK